MTMGPTLAFQGASGQVYRLDRRLAQGGQGTVYRVIGADGQPQAVKWYHARLASAEQRAHLERLIRHGAPEAGVDGIGFIWPLELATLPDRPGYGYVMPLYDSDRYQHLNRVINGKRRQPTLAALCRLGYLICLALESVHRAGLAYCDINLGNIQFDFDAAALIVCDNDNVVVNNAAVGVMGVPEFMAPEVALGRQHPNAQSDLYSLALLLYQLWMWEHPMEGGLTARVRCWDQPAKRKYYAEEPLFAHHPGDRRNGAEGDPMLACSLARWERLCPARLQACFTRTFTDGVHDPNQRTRLAEWQRLFMELEADALRCPACSAVNLIDPEAARRVCFHCGTPLGARLRLQIRYPGGGARLAAHPAARLRRHHLEVEPARARLFEPVGAIEPHPGKAGALILRNLTAEPWFYAQGTDRYRIDPGQARPLVPGGQLLIGNATVEILEC